MYMTRLVRRFCVFVGMCAVFSACQWKHEAIPTIVLFSFDQLPANSMPCSTEDLPNQPGLSVLCQESIRFTHAYTTSTLSRPALTSVLTGQLPSQSGVQTNADSLKAEVSTLAESAIESGFETAFFSGGPSILRQSGLQQGFDLFDDTFLPTPDRLFRPLAVNTTHFNKWASNHAGKPWFVVFYIPDLAFKNTPTMNRLGEPQELSYQTQRLSADQALYSTIDFLKKMNRWDHAQVFTFGLNGKSEQKGLAPAMDLRSANTEVALLIKPGLVKEGAQPYSVDRNVSLVDLYPTLLDLMKSKGPRVHQQNTFSLAHVLAQPTPDWPADRLIVTESSWSKWLEGGTIAYALRVGDLLCLYHKKRTCFNSLTDPSEDHSLPNEDPLIRAHQSQLAQFDFGGLNSPTDPPRIKSLQPALMDLDLWTHPRISLTRLRALTEDHLGLIAWEYIRHKNWNQLLQLSQKSKDQDWRALAQRWLHPELGSFQDPCLKLIDKPKDANSNTCRQPEILAIWRWANFEPEPATYRYLLKSFYLNELDRKIAETNRGLGWIWNVDSQAFMQPTPIELALALPSQQKLRSQLERDLPAPKELVEF